MNSTDRKLIKFKHKKFKKSKWNNKLKYSTRVLYAWAEIKPRFQLACLSNQAYFSDYKKHLQDILSSYTLLYLTLIASGI